MSAKRPPTIEDVAQAADVSNMTVSRVVNGNARVSEATRLKVLGVMAKLGYQPNALAKGMRSNTTKTIGFILPDLTNPLNALVTQAVEATLAVEGYRMLVASTRFDLDREALYFEQFQAQMVDGIIAMLANDESPQISEVIAKARKPVVVIDRDLDVPVDAVLCEHQSTMTELVRYLVGLGHERIGLINGPKSIRPARHRHAAFMKALNDLGKPDPTEFIRTPSTSVEDGYLAAIDLLKAKTPPTALIVCSNQNMFGALQAIREMGLRIPEEISMVGADENLASALLNPPLTMIYRDIAKMGESAARLMLERLSDPDLPTGRTLAVPSQIILRQSCSFPSRK